MGQYQYFVKSARGLIGADVSCPFDNSTNTKLLKRKMVVTALYECKECGLRFRVPKDTAEENRNFYQSEYSQGFTTDCPTDNELGHLLDTNFRNSEKDYGQYIQILKSAGMQTGQSIIDFGSSWGYGSWQLSQAGYTVYSYEISKPRASYAKDKLGCTIIEDLARLPAKVDCVFSAHVIEHLPDPKIFWHWADSALKRNGTIIAITPNGDPIYEASRSEIYHQRWGRVHPLLFTSKALHQISAHYGFAGSTHSSPYDLQGIRNLQNSNLEGDELLYVGRKLSN